jgi:integrase
MFADGKAWQTVRNIWIVLSSILKAAVEYGYLDENPARRVRFPPQPPPKERRVLAGDEIQRLLEQLEEPFKTMAILVLLTGLRIGEVLAICWGSVDLLTGSIRISQSLFKGRFQQPKSARSLRTMPVGPFGAELLKAHYQRSAKREKEDLLFAHPDGRPIAASYVLQHKLQPAGLAAGVGHVTWHLLRHVHSSLLHDLGTPAKIVQEQLGHANYSTTMNTYTHVVADSRREAVNDLESLLFPSVPKSGEGQSDREVVIQ